jgi:hypothetical protein
MSHTSESLNDDETNYDIMFTIFDKIYNSEKRVMPPISAWDKEIGDAFYDSGIVVIGFDIKTQKLAICEEYSRDVKPPTPRLFKQISTEQLPGHELVHAIATFIEDDEFEAPTEKAWLRDWLTSALTNILNGNDAYIWKEWEPYTAKVNVFHIGVNIHYAKTLLYEPVLDDDIVKPAKDILTSLVGDLPISKLKSMKNLDDITYDISDQIATLALFMVCISP